MPLVRAPLLRLPPRANARTHARVYSCTPTDRLLSPAPPPQRLLDELVILGDATYRGFLKKGTDYNTGQDVALLTRVDPQSDLRRTADTAPFPSEGSQCHYNGAGDSTQVGRSGSQMQEGRREWRREGDEREGGMQTVGEVPLTAG